MCLYNSSNFIQRISRCNRIDSENEDKVANVLVWSKDDTTYNKIQNILSSNLIKVRINTNEYSRKETSLLTNKEIFNFEETTKESTLKEKMLVYLRTEKRDEMLVQFAEKFIFPNFDNRNEFVIDSENLRKWLAVTSRKDFYNTIKRSYEFNKDYIKAPLVKRVGSGGHNEVRFLLTPNCTKKICQSTKCKKGVKIREYFLEIEDILYKEFVHLPK